MRSERASLWGLLVPLSLIPALLAVFQLGRLHPDEVYQHLEPANFKAFGYGIMAWEWQQGLRNWAVPGFFAYLLKAADAVGIHDAQARRAVLEVPQWALHVAMLFAVYRLCRRRVQHLPSLAATALVGLYGPVLAFSGRTLGESLSTALMVMALERLDDNDTKWTVAMLGGALLGMAVVTRYGSAVVVVAAMATLLAMRRFKHFGWATLGGCVIALTLGALDKASWGTWFHSLLEYSKFNVFSQQAAQRFGANPGYFYLPFLGMVPLWVWPALKNGLKQRTMLAPLFLVSAVVYALAISFTSHKEARFLYPSLVLLAVGVVPALVDGLQRLSQKWRPTWLYAAAVAASGVLFFVPTPFSVERPEMYRLVVKGGRDATGLFIIPEGVWGAPGFFYLGKNIPWFTCDFPADPRFQQAVRSPVFNRVVSVDGHGEKELLAAGFKELAQDGNSKLFGR